MHLGECALGQVAQFGQAACHPAVALPALLLEGELDGSGMQGHREQRLGYRVVQLGGQPVSLLAAVCLLEGGHGRTFPLDQDHPVQRGPELLL